MTACGAQPHETASLQTVGVFKTTINGKQAVIARGDEEVALTFKEVKTMENGAEYFFTGERPTEVMEYDTYVDEEDRTYLYLKGTDVLAGIKDKLILGEGTPREQAVTADHARQKAQDYLVDYIGMDEFQDYTFKRCEYLAGGGYYTVLYAYEIDGIATTDTMDVFVRADGSVGGFSAFNRGAYRGLPDAEQRVAAAKAAQSPLKSSPYLPFVEIFTRLFSFLLFPTFPISILCTLLYHSIPTMSICFINFFCSLYEKNAQKDVLTHSSVFSFYRSCILHRSFYQV